MPKRNKAGYDGKRQLAVADIENPYGKKGDREEVIINIRESTIELMLARNQIDMAQHRSAVRFRHLYESMYMTNMAVDTAREPVDVSGQSDPIPDRILDAGLEISKAMSIMGRENAGYVVWIAGDGLTIREAAARVVGSAPRQYHKRVVAKSLKRGLDRLAEYWGYAGRKNIK